MSRSIPVQFLGGPIDGVRRWIEETPYYYVAVAPEWDASFWDHGPEEAMEPFIERHVYQIRTRAYAGGLYHGIYQGKGGPR